MLPVAILAGGLARRLRPITETIPKALVEVAGKPFIFHQLERLRSEGVSQVVLCLGHLGERIVEAVGDGSGVGLTVDYSFDGDKLLGTGGALRQALPKLGSAFFVLYGDSYLRCPFCDVCDAFVRSEKPALMTVLKNEGQWDRSNVVFRDGRLVRYDKRETSADMIYVDYGLSVIRAAILANQASTEVFDLADTFMDLSRAGQLAGYEVGERFYEIGSLNGLRETEEYLLGLGT